MKIISLGWGVQSFTLAAMVALGELEPVDFAIHADTTHESALTYEFASRWTPWLQKRGVVVVVVVANHEKKIKRQKIVGEKGIIDMEFIRSRRRFIVDGIDVLTDIAT